MSHKHVELLLANTVAFRKTSSITSIEWDLSSGLLQSQRIVQWVHPVGLCIFSYFPSKKMKIQKDDLTMIFVHLLMTCRTIERCQRFNPKSSALISSTFLSQESWHNVSKSSADSSQSFLAESTAKKTSARLFTRVRFVYRWPNAFLNSPKFSKVSLRNYSATLSKMTIKVYLNKIWII